MRLRDQPLDHFCAPGTGEDGIARLELANFELDGVFFRFAYVGWV